MGWCSAVRTDLLRAIFPVSIDRRMEVEHLESLKASLRVRAPEKKDICAYALKCLVHTKLYADAIDAFQITGDLGVHSPEARWRVVRLITIRGRREFH